MMRQTHSQSTSGRQFTCAVARTVNGALHREWDFEATKLTKVVGREGGEERCTVMGDRWGM